MSPSEQYRRETDALQTVLDAPAELREKVIHEVCGEDSKLEARVRALLQEHDETLTLWRRLPGGAPIDVQPGEILCERFALEQRLGEGGMGQVWAAQDRQVGERVAVKLIRPDLLLRGDVTARFKQELQLARKIGHPNICRVFELFEDRTKGIPHMFLTMELLSGETLSSRLKRDGPLAPRAAVEILRQILDGLTAAHELGIIHRDLKPGNIMLALSPAGQRAIIMDFGLARYLAGDHVEGATTYNAAVLGTPDYMAPEQATSNPITPAADIYAFGLTAYQMLTGEVPLKGGNATETAMLRARQKPEPPSRKAKGIDHHLDRIVLRCLEFEPSQRYRSAAELRREFDAHSHPLFSRRAAIAAGAAAVLMTSAALVSTRFRTQPAAEPSPRIAVIPFEPIGDAGNQQYLADGLSEQILSLLEKNGFQVAARGSSFSFRGRSVPLADIARQLGAAWVLTGTLRLHGDTVSVYAQIVDGNGVPGKWSGRFEAGHKDLHKLSVEIASAGGLAISPRLQGAFQLSTSNAEANDYYLRGRYHWERRDPKDQELALSFYEKAVALDGNFALARCGIAEALAGMADLGYRKPAEALPRAKQEVLEAIRANAKLGHAYAVFANLATLWESDYDTAARYFEQAISLEPYNVLSYVWYSHLLLKTGKLEDAMRMAREAFRRDPLNLRVHMNAGSMAYFTRNYAEALERLREVSQKAPDYYLIHEVLAEVCARLGMRQEALREADMALHESRHKGHAMAFAANAYAILGEKERSLAALRELTHSNGKITFEAVHVARAFAEMGRAEDALQWLEVAYKKKETGLQTLPVYHSYDPIRRDPRFVSFAERARKLQRAL
ncbi:MAG: protein kinase [Bryobacteraceae bacterium]